MRGWKVDYVEVSKGLGKKYEMYPFLVVLLKYHAKYRFDAGYRDAH